MRASPSSWRTAGVPPLGDGVRLSRDPQVAAEQRSRHAVLAAGFRGLDEQLLRPRRPTEFGALCPLLVCLRRSEIETPKEQIDVPGEDAAHDLGALQRHRPRCGARAERAGAREPTAEALRPLRHPLRLSGRSSGCSLHRGHSMSSSNLAAQFSWQMMQCSSPSRSSKSAP